jgi:hypothetical protein
MTDNKQLSGYTLRKSGVRRKGRHIRVLLPETMVLKLMENRKLKQDDAERVLLNALLHPGFECCGMTVGADGDISYETAEGQDQPVILF